MRRTNEGTLLHRVGLVQQLLIEFDFDLVLEIPVIFGVHRARQIFLDIDHRVDDALAVALQRHIEIAAAHRRVPWADRRDALPHIEAHLAPLIDQPATEIFEPTYPGFPARWT